MEKDSVDLVLEIKGIAEHLELKLQAELQYLRDERDTVVRTLTKVSNELDLARRTGGMVLRAAYDSLKAEHGAASQRHKDELKAARAENDKLRKAKNEAFRRLTNQNILLEKIQALETEVAVLKNTDGYWVVACPNEQGTQEYYTGRPADRGETGSSAWSTQMPLAMRWKDRPDWDGAGSPLFIRKGA